MKFIIVTPVATEQPMLLNTKYIEQIRPVFEGTRIFLFRQTDAWGFEVKESFEEILDLLKDQ